MTKPVTYPRKLTPELREVLGLSLFQTATIAMRLRQGGQMVPKAPDDARADVLHWLIPIAIEHGPDFMLEANRQLGEMIAREPYPPPAASSGS